MARTTLILDDGLMRELKRIAAAEGRTLSELTQEALRRGLEARKGGKRRTAPKLPSFDMGEPLIDLADRDRLYDVLDEE